jgi:NodT family efflux transporter outer membrane factor (OMF) lipoprotein
MRGHLSLPGLSILAAALILSGCATPVPQSLPGAMQPKTFMGPVQADASVWPDTEWWKQFGDAELSALVIKAQAQNRDLARAAASVLAAEAQSTIARSALFPQLGGQAGHLNEGCNGQSCLDFGSAKAYQLTFNASYEIDFWGLARDNLKAANEELKSARFAQEVVALTVTANVADQYLNVLALRRRIAIANDDIAAINNILSVIKLRVKAGSISNLDLAQETAQLESVQSQLPTLESAERSSLYTLAVLLGQPPEGFEVKSDNLEGVAAPKLAPGLPSELLLRRPDVAEAEANLAAGHADLDAARAAFFPSISLTGSGGFVSAAIGTLLQGPNFGYAYGINLVQTIFDGGKLIGQKDQAAATQDALIASYQSAALGAYADVETALVQVANSERSATHLRGEIDAAREAFGIASLQYTQGAADLLTVLQAQQTLFSAEDQLAQTELANRQAIVHLFEALGGGWQEAPVDRTQLAVARLPEAIAEREKPSSSGAD